MPKRYDYTGKDVQDVYDGPGGLLWEAVMSEQIHSGKDEVTDRMAAAVGLKPGMHVLDVCSALGAPARHIAKKHGVKVTGLDFTKTMNIKAIERNKAAGLDNVITIVEGNAMDMPFKKDTFCAVWGQEAWCYVTNKDQLMAEAYRVLAPGGRFYVDIPNITHPGVEAMYLVEEHMGRPILLRMPSAEFEGMLRGLFRIDRTDTSRVMAGYCLTRD